MSWFAAHAIMSVRFKEGAQDSYPVYENVYLIEAADGSQALVEATARAEQDQGDSSGTLTWGDRPATIKLAGIRKVVAVSHHGSSEHLATGDEVTYSQFEVPDEASLQQLVDGEGVVVNYAE